MKKDIKFIVGLSGWGKSTCIQKIVGSSGSIKTTHKGIYRIIQINGKNVIIQQFSNCDIGVLKYIKELEKLLKQLDSNENIDYAIAALCCSSIDAMSQILKTVNTHNFNIELLFLENHWDYTASLNISNISQKLQANTYTFTTKVVNSSCGCHSKLF